MPPPHSTTAKIMPPPHSTTAKIMPPPHSTTAKIMPPPHSTTAKIMPPPHSTTAKIMPPPHSTTSTAAKIRVERYLLYYLHSLCTCPEHLEFSSIKCPLIYGVCPTALFCYDQKLSLKPTNMTPNLN